MFHHCGLRERRSGFSMRACVFVVRPKAMSRESQFFSNDIGSDFFSDITVGGHLVAWIAHGKWATTRSIQGLATVHRFNNCARIAVISVGGYDIVCCGSFLSVRFHSAVQSLRFHYP